MKDKLLDALERACTWITDVAQIKNEGDEVGCKRTDTMLQKSWKGALRGEYSAADRSWSMFCPVWHTGQAVKALCMAYKLTGNQKWFDAAVFGGDFILNQQITDENSPEYGLIYAIEDFDRCINISAILESLEGFRWLYLTTNDEKYKKAYMIAVDWIARNAYNGNGHFQDIYDIDQGKIIDNPLTKNFAAPEGFPVRDERPLADDAVFLRAYEFSGDEKYRKIFYQTVDFLKEHEVPEGTWNNYQPSNGLGGVSHPRQSFWWGHPMYYAYKDTYNSSYYECMKRCGEWYINAQRSDGSLFRSTYLDFKTPSFGLCTSGISCAAILWIKLNSIDRAPRWMNAVHKALTFNMNVQFRNASDPNLEGAVLERTVAPRNGSDASPYYLRDLSTIFFVQAACTYLGVE